MSVLPTAFLLIQTSRMLEFLPLLAVGMLAGLMAGLFGIGGGLIIVPAMVLFFASGGIEAIDSIKVAIGTSLATNAITAISSIRAHHGRGAVDWDLVKRISPGIVFGAGLGAIVADWLPGGWLAWLFIGFLLYAARDLFRDKPKAHDGLPSRWVLWTVGTLVGMVSSILGISGGSMNVPFLAGHGVPIKRAVGTAAALGFPLAAFGALGFVLAGLNEQDLPVDGLGYVYPPAVLSLAMTSVLFAPLGARLAHSLPEIWLRRAFAGFLLVVAAKMGLDLI